MESCDGRHPREQCGGSSYPEAAMVFPEAGQEHCSDRSTVDSSLLQPVWFQTVIQTHHFSKRNIMKVVFGDLACIIVGSRPHLEP